MKRDKVIVKYGEYSAEIPDGFSRQTILSIMEVSMLNDYVCPGRVHLPLGRTDLWKGIDGLAVMIQEHYGKSIEENDIFIFCGLRNDRIKALLWEGDRFLLLYKRLEKGDICGYKLVKFGSEQYEFKIIPAKVILLRDITDVYKCSHCEETSGETVIKEAEKPSSIIPGSLATAEAIAHIATKKFVQGTPLYRQEQ